jgi:oxygen-dependent protoporphyrinogen oxidase
VPTSSPPSVAVVGGGISGLAAAWRLRQRGAAVTLFEASERTGGVIRSRRQRGFLVDEGPNTLVARSAALGEAIAEVGLGEERVPAPDAANARYVVRDGALVRVPTSPAGFLTTPLLSARAKLRLLGEPFVRPGASDDESLAAFVRRRLGPEVLDYAVNPFVAGVYAGDPERLSTRWAFPALHTLEREHGSLVRGLVHRVRNRTAGAQSGGAKKPSSHPFSFRSGMQALPDAFARALGDAVRLGSPVVALHRDADGWSLTVETDGTRRAERFDGVAFTAPLHTLSEIAFDTDVDLSPLAAVTYPPLSVLALGFREADVEHTLDGFGALVPEREGLRILGALFSSTLFPGRAPAGHALITCFVGGMRHPDLAALPEDDLVALALEDLGPLLGVRGEPAFVHRKLWEHAIPQYHVGYGAVIATMEALEARHPGLRFAGNVRRGISVGDALEAGLEAADRLLPSAHPAA